jgi:hypothetical protein
MQESPIRYVQSVGLHRGQQLPEFRSASGGCDRTHKQQVANCIRSISPTQVTASCQVQRGAPPLRLEGNKLNGERE